MPYVARSDVDHEGAIPKNFLVVKSTKSFEQGFACCEMIPHNYYLVIRPIIKHLSYKYLYRKEGENYVNYESETHKELDSCYVPSLFQ